MADSCNVDIVEIVSIAGDFNALRSRVVPLEKRDVGEDVVIAGDLEQWIGE